MQDLTTRSFGNVISYLIPGFIGLAGLSDYSPRIYLWFGAPAATAPTVGGFLYVTLGSVALGLVLSTVRWLLLDATHHRTGVTRPTLDFAALGDCLVAYSLITDHHYAYYKFYGNTLVAMIALCLVELVAGLPHPAKLAVLVLMQPLLYLGSRDTLRKYYSRAHQLLNAQPKPISVRKPESETS